jgi:hypothetical protein
MTIYRGVKYRGADKSLAWPTSLCILFDGENISFDASLITYINSTNTPPIMIINRIYGTRKSSDTVACFFPGQAKELSAPLYSFTHSSLHTIYSFWSASHSGHFTPRKHPIYTMFTELSSHQSQYGWCDHSAFFIFHQSVHSGMCP